MIALETARLAVVGLGYVGLPLAVEFGKHRPVIGFDIKRSRIAELKRGHDRTLEVPDEDIETSAVNYTDNPSALMDANVFIVTTPTPIDEHKRPDLGPLLSASEMIGHHMPEGSVVIYESTVYPGATEEDCVPVLERASGHRLNKGFFVGYSPERINPGDKTHRLDTIVKVTAGSTPAVCDFVDTLYQTIVSVGTHKAPSIKVAEAAKVIENTQRDVNIALINELAILFARLGIDTSEVLEAASTKWNFLPFRPGLVGGHCIGVDPYYLTHKAQEVGHHPELILAGRRINDAMGRYAASRLVKKMITTGMPVHGSHVLVMGVTFKENTPDLRNSRVIDFIRELEDFGIVVDVHDPLADPHEAIRELGLALLDSPKLNHYDAVVLAVPHEHYRQMSIEQIRQLRNSNNSVIYDLKGILPKDSVDLRL